MAEIFRFLTAGESHGEALTAVIDGVPAGLPLTMDAPEGASAQETLGAKDIGHPGVHDLDRHRLALPDVTREIDLRHGALPQLALDHVAIAQYLGQHLQHRGHLSPGLTRPR